MACLLQCLNNTGVLEDVGPDVLQDLIVQIAFNQVLNELDVVTTQRDEACKDLYQTAMGRRKQIASSAKELS